MADPTILVEFEWDAGVWTNEASRCLAWDTDRGRRFELDDYAAGVATIVLDNADRRFDPLYAAGPLFGKLKPNRRVRIRATWAGVTEGQYQGSVDRIEQTYLPPHVATATVTATDAFKQLSRAILPNSVYEATITGTVYAWWRLGDPGGSTQATERVGQRHAAVVGSVTFGEEGLVSRDSTSSATFGPGGYLRVPATVTPLGSGGGIPTWTIAFVCKSAGGQVVNEFLYQQSDGTGNTNHIEVLMWNSVHPSAGKLDVIVRNSTAGILSATSGARVDDGNPHQVHVTYHGGTDLRIYIDGVLSGSGAGIAATTILAPTNVIIGNSLVDPTSTYWRGTLQDFTLSGIPTSAATALAVYDARKTGGQWAADLSGARVNRILAAVGYAGTTSVDAGNSALQSTDLGGNALSYLQAVARSEGGRLYVDNDGVLQFDQRTSTFNPPAVAAYGDQPGELGYTNLGYVRDAADIRNDIAVSRLDGTAHRVTDTASVAEYGRMSYAEEGLYLSSDADVLDRANFLLAQYKDPQDRIGTLAVNPYAAESTLFPRVLTDDIGAGVTVTRRPQNVGAAATGFYSVDAVAHQWVPKQWSTTYGLAPLSTTAGSGQFLQLDDLDGPGLDGVRLAY